MSDIDFELEYKGGGFFREKGIDVVISARMVHGKEILKYVASLKKDLSTAQARLSANEVILSQAKEDNEKLQAKVKELEGQVNTHDL